MYREEVGSGVVLCAGRSAGCGSGSSRSSGLEKGMFRVEILHIHK